MTSGAAKRREKYVSIYLVSSLIAMVLEMSKIKIKDQLFDEMLKRNKVKQRRQNWKRSEQEMEIITGLFSFPIGRFSLVFFITMITCAAATVDNNLCSSSCGEIRNISSPFRLQTDPLHCGDLRYNLSCDSNVTVLYFYADDYDQTPKQFFVEAINYNNFTIRLSDPGIRDGNCSSVPANTIARSTTFFLDWDPYFYEAEIRSGFRSQASMSGNPKASFKNTRVISQTVIFLTCEKAMNSSNYIESSCVFKGNCVFNSSTAPSRRYSYYRVMDDNFGSSDLDGSCCIEQVSLVSAETLLGSQDIYEEIGRGFELSWVQSFDKRGDRLCYVDDKNPNKVSCLSGCSFIDYRVSFGCSPFHTFLAYLQLYLFINGGYKYVVGVLAPRTLIGFLFIIGLLIYKWRRRHLSIYEEIEKFLQTHHNLAPIRYSYAEIKKMSKGFKEKLGEGGFGSVYKGKLRSGHLVAIKILGKSKGTPNWQDFINEVATIGRIHHVNIAQLIGFCVEGSKRALIFDFMSNGSLDKYIFTGEETSSLSCDEIFQIALGVARGIEYLHSGCDMQILHFDIKPHNILLDDNFAAKISDFGLARLCALDDSMVCLTAARGTIGYMAPELFYKNIGGVSDKADVYSFGMLLMEMANGRRNTNVGSDDSDGTYFPLWIHDQFTEGKGIESVKGSTESEQKTIKKMMIVALWCIQLKPSDRPSMDRVTEMLEGEVEDLEMPPKPYLFPQERNVVNDISGTSSDATSTWSSDQNSMEISLTKSINSEIQNSQ